MTLEQPQYLCIGHCCHDKTPKKGYILGGTASYASVAARQLGYSAAILTSVGSDFKFLNDFKKKKIDILCLPAHHTTVFENIYTPKGRIQYLHSRAETLEPNNIPKEWQDAPIIHFCPIADEVSFPLLKKFPNSLKCATIQGWLRQWDKEGRITPKEMDWQQLANVDIVVMSDADIAGYEYIIPSLTKFIKILVVTKGANGATIYLNNIEHFFPSFPVREVDATGAGDVFATAFFIQYHRTHDIALACAFAHAAASFVVEGVGLNNLKAIENIEKRYEEYQSRFL